MTDRSADGYVELRCRSAFSFLSGAALPEELARRAAELGHSALALSDVGGFYAAPRFAKACAQHGIRPLFGAELEVEGHPLLLLCEQPVGYRNLCRLLTRERMRARSDDPETAAPLGFSELEEHAQGLIALTGGGEGLLGAAITEKDKARVFQALDSLSGVFGRGRLYVELQVHFDEQEDRRNRALIELARRYGLPLVATNDVRFARPEQLLLCDALTCVRHGVTLAEAGRKLLPNAERHLKSPSEMAELFADLPEAIESTRAIAERCQFSLRDLSYRFPDFPLPPGHSQDEYLRAIVFEAAAQRFRPLHERAQRQLDHELVLIKKLGLSGYFLIVWDLIQFCRQRGILVQGRGSAANSAVCFALGITACDPLKMDLLFERFLSEERGEWPDIDLDLPSGSRREEVLQYLYRKYGPHGCAMTACVITYRERSAVRDLGKVLGMPLPAIERLSASLSRWGGDGGAEGLLPHLEKAELDPRERSVQRFVALWQELQELPRHIGQHPGGMVIAAGRLDEVVPLEPASMPGRVILQWDKDDVADLGIVKMDLLGLGMMAALEEAVALVPQHDGVAFDLAALPPDDPAVYKLLQTADTIGVFQVESRAQMSILPRLRPARFYDLVVQVGLIRPGPIQGNMVHPYLRRRAGREDVRYAHPSLQPILERTLGVPLFQEQIMRVAMVAAGFSGGQADQLRRAMGKRRSEKQMAMLCGALRSGMAERGLTGAAAEEIIQAITSFAEYGFPESHAISFAHLTYGSAYLKVHHPAVFYVTLLNAWPMGFYHPATLIRDAQRHGVRVRPIDVNLSLERCTLESGQPAQLNQMNLFNQNGMNGSSGSNTQTAAHGEASGLDRQAALRSKSRRHDLRLGLRFVRGLKAQAQAELVSARAAGPFQSLAELRRRCPGLSKRELETLAEIGALAGLKGQPSRREALWQVSALPSSGLLLHGEGGGELEGDPHPLPEMSLGERMAADYHGTSVSLGPHPIKLLRPQLAAAGFETVTAHALTTTANGRRVAVAGQVIVRQRPPTARGFFFLTLEDESGLCNVIVSPDDYERERAILGSAAALLIEGVLQNQDGAISVKADRFADLARVI